MSEENANRFLSDCWTVVLARGRENSSIACRAQTAWGLNPDGALCYRDRQVEIVAEESPSKRLLVTKRGTSRLGAETSNPIVCTNREGEPIRWHGEYVKIAAHVRVLALSTLKEQPAETSSEGSRER